MNLLQKTLESWFRYGLAGIGGLIFGPPIVGHVMGADAVNQWRLAFDSFASLAAAAIVTVVWPLGKAWWNHVRAKAKLVVAAAMPSTTTEAVTTEVNKLGKRKTLEVALNETAPAAVYRAGGTHENQ